MLLLAVLTCVRERITMRFTRGMLAHMNVPVHVRVRVRIRVHVCFLGEHVCM